LDLLNQIIHESTLAPSAGNEQPWKFIVVWNPYVLRKISDAYKGNLEEATDKRKILGWMWVFSRPISPDTVKARLPCMILWALKRGPSFSSIGTRVENSCKNFRFQV
jgi:nitroreductase